MEEGEERGVMWGKGFLLPFLYSRDAQPHAPHAQLKQMDDPELEAIRQKRLAEMRGAGGAQMPGGGGGDNSIEAQQRKEQQKQEQEERRQMILQQILTPEARERLSRIKLVKPDKARGVEDLLIRAAQSGQIAEKVGEARLISLLEQLSEKEKKTTVTIKRRSALDDD